MSKLPKSVRDGFLEIGKWKVHAYVLDDETRVITSTESYEMIGLAGRRRTELTIERLSNHPLLKDNPATRAAEQCLVPVLFKLNDGALLEGTDALSLVDMARFLLKAREFNALQNATDSRAAQAAESFIVSIAQVGMAALIDEATGYQELRDSRALRVLLDKYLKREHAIWAKRFPDEFYMQIFRLKGWEWKGMQVNRPSIVGTYTSDIVYARIGPGLLEELENLNPVLEEGRRDHKHHQHLTEDIGHPALERHIFALIALMRTCNSWAAFKVSLKKAFPRQGDQLDLGLDLADSDLD